MSVCFPASSNVSVCVELFDYEVSIAVGVNKSEINDRISVDIADSVCFEKFERSQHSGRRSFLFPRAASAVSRSGSFCCAGFDVSFEDSLILERAELHSSSRRIPFIPRERRDESRLG